MRRLLQSSAALALVLALSACETIDQADQQINEAARLTNEQAARLAAAQRGEVQIVDRPYFGEAVRVPLGETRGQPIPREFEAAKGVDIRNAACLLQTRQTAF